MAPESDVLVVSVGATPGWSAAARELVEGLQRAGARVRLAAAGPLPAVRRLIATDFVQARAARRACQRALAEGEPAAIVYCSIAASLLWPRPGAIWLDTIAAEYHVGRDRLWQRRVERRRIAQAPLILTMADNSLAPLPESARPEPVLVPVAVDASGPPAPVRDIDVLAYTGDPIKRRLDFILDGWRRARRQGETLVVAGIERDDRIEGVRFVGHLPPDEYRALVRRARVYVAAPVREDFGIAPLEALADGCMLVTTPSPGPYVALGLARALDPRLVADDLGPALRAALDDPLPGYAERAAQLLEPFTRAAVDATIADRVLPRLLPAWVRS